MIVNSKLSNLPRKLEFSLNEIKKALLDYGNPQDSYQSILVAGTNGKGSTTAFLSSILSSKYRVGSYFSPHLEFYNERIVVDGEYIPDADWEEWEPIIFKEAKKYNLSFFEALTFFALNYFKERKVDIAVIEVGMGGRLDATNVVNNKVGIITSLSKDHVDFLGNSIEEILLEKLCIVKDKGIINPSRHYKKVISVLPKSRCLKTTNSNNLFFYNKEIKTNIKKFSINKLSFIYDDVYNNRFDVELSMVNLDQPKNAALALFSSLFYLNNNDIDITRLSSVKLKARFEVIKEKPLVIIDGSHNPQGISSFVKTYRRLVKKLNRKPQPLIVFSVMKDKDWKKMIKTLHKISNFILVTQLSNNKRSASPIDIAKYAKKLGFNVFITFDEYSALRKALVMHKIDKVPLIFIGSFYFVGRVRRMLIKALS